MRTLTLSIALVCALDPVAVSQAFAYHPSTNPLTSQSSNNYPFGAGAPYGFRFVNHIPASALDPANPYITDVSFFCPTSGTWSSGSVKVGIGHLVDPPPCPFTFPDGAGGSGIGNFTDLTIMWDGTTDGPLAFNVGQDQWSPLGLAASGRPPFQWNGRRLGRSCAQERLEPFVQSLVISLFFTLLLESSVVDAYSLRSVRFPGVPRGTSWNYFSLIIRNYL